MDVIADFSSRVWNWCVEYDHQGEKQLWIYSITSHRGGEGFNLCKWQVVQRLGEGGLTHKIWDDIVLRDGEVECELVNHTSLDQPFPLEPFNNENAPPIYVCSLHNFY
jgi:hypothetical protein